MRLTISVGIERVIDSGGVGLKSRVPDAESFLEECPQAPIPALAPGRGLCASVPGVRREPTPTLTSCPVRRVWGLRRLALCLPAVWYHGLYKTRPWSPPTTASLVRRLYTPAVTLRRRASHMVSHSRSVSPPPHALARRASCHPSQSSPARWRAASPG